jgi:hypothetical protein
MLEKERIKHLEFIQNILTRMNHNSFQIKNWSVITIAAIFTISLTQKDAYILLIALMPIALFWCLDAYYLMQERKFRRLYNQVLDKDKDLKPFEMNTSAFSGGECSYRTVLRSKTIWSFYTTMTVIVMVIFFAICY